MNVTKVYNNFDEYIRERTDRDKHSLGIVHFNIRSLQKHFDELLVYMEMAGDRLDIIVLSETREILNVEQFKIPNFSVYYNEALFNKCDGVVVYVRDSINALVNIAPINESKFLRVTFSSSYIPNNNKIGLTAY